MFDRSSVAIISLVFLRVGIVIACGTLGNTRWSTSMDTLKVPDFDQVQQRWVRCDTVVEFEATWEHICQELNVEHRCWLQGCMTNVNIVLSVI